MLCWRLGLIACGAASMGAAVSLSLAPKAQ
jgi:hypothetical protein